MGKVGPMVERDYCQPGSCQNSVLVMNDPTNSASGISGPKLVNGYFKAPVLCRSTVSASSDPLPFLEKGWIQHVTGPTRKCNFLDFLFTTCLTHFQISTEAGLPGCNHLPFSCSFALPLQDKQQPPKEGPDFRSVCNRLSALVRSLSCHSLFLRCKCLLTSYILTCTSVLMPLPLPKPQIRFPKYFS